MRKKGFTLIELLAVIIILAVIALIATPVVLKVVDSAKRQANIQTANGIMDAAKLYFAEAMFDSSKKQNIDDVNDIYNLVTVSGKKPEEGSLLVNNKGQIAISIIIDEKCYAKTFDGKLEEYDSDDENCYLEYLSNDNTEPIVTYSLRGTMGQNDWYNTNVYATINIEDNESDIDYYRWCTGINCEPLASETNTQKTLNLTNTDETEVCVEAYDKSGNSSTTCSETMKIDEMLPEINFDDIPDTIKQGDEYPIPTSVIYGISGGTTVCKVGDKLVTNTKELEFGKNTLTCTATSNSGLITTLTKIITVN